MLPILAQAVLCRGSAGVGLGQVKHITSNKGEGMWRANKNAVMANKAIARLLSASVLCCGEM